MSTNPQRPRWLEALDDPEASEMLRETLETLVRLSQTVGRAQLVEALQASFALTNDPTLRADYDALRSRVIGYLQTIDDGKLQPQAAKGEFRASPALSGDDVTKLVELLQPAAADEPKPR